MPEVTVIMPMRNARPFVTEALQSILVEREIELEVIVIDDGSTDGSGVAVSAIDDPRVRMVAGPGEGIAAAFNVGLAESMGKIIMRCDADDRYPPQRISLQVRLGEACRVWYVPQTTYVYRLHDASITHSMRTQEREFYERQARFLQTQRLQTGTDDVELGMQPKYTRGAPIEGASAASHMQ